VKPRTREHRKQHRQERGVRRQRARGALGGQVLREGVHDAVDRLVGDPFVLVAASRQDQRLVVVRASRAEQPLHEGGLADARGAFEREQHRAAGALGAGAAQRVELGEPPDEGDRRFGRLGHLEAAEARQELARRRSRRRQRIEQLHAQVVERRGDAGDVLAGARHRQAAARQQACQ
jgi:hypothetical protein